MLTVTLEDEAWTPAMDDDGHAAVLAGLSSSQREALGWETVVAKGLDPSALEQLDRSSIQITLPPFESYDLRAAETLRLTIPARALLSGRDVEVEEELPVRAVAGTATLSGLSTTTCASGRSGVSSRWIAESNALFSERMQLNITLADDEWVALDDEEVAASSSPRSARPSRLLPGLRRPAGRLAGAGPRRAGAADRLGRHRAEQPAELRPLPALPRTLLVNLRARQLWHPHARGALDRAAAAFARVQHVARRAAGGHRGDGRAVLRRARCSTTCTRRTCTMPSLSISPSLLTRGSSCSSSNTPTRSPASHRRSRSGTGGMPSTATRSSPFTSTALTRAPSGLAARAAELRH